MHAAHAHGHQHHHGVALAQLVHNVRNYTDFIFHVNKKLSLNDGCAMAALFGRQRHHHQTLGATSFRGVCRLRRLLQLADGLDQNKNAEGDDEEVDDIIYENTVMDDHRFCVSEGRLQRDRHIAKINAPDEHAQRRHENIIHKRGDNLTESGADNHTYRQIHDIAAA